MRTHLFLVSALLVFGGFSAPAAATPVATDSRIKTLVYSPNEVFTVTTHYGYQSNIEFGARETIDTVSIGDRVGWQIIPAGRRLFIRSMEENAHTNMTVVTNLRAYQFDLRSSGSEATLDSDQLTYVVRFFYPEDVAQGIALPVTYVRDIPPPPAPMPPPVAAPLPSAAMNYHYTYSGPDSAAPVKIYDDGKSTYFKFRGDLAPQIAVLTTKGEAMHVPTHRTADGVVVVDVVAPRFRIEQAGQQVIVYNEANGVL